MKQEKTKPYDATATVVKVEGGIAWIHIPGGVDQTPVEKTIDCKTGDRVTVRVSGGKAWITGNATAPPTDDRAANKAGETAKDAQKTAREALKIKQHFWTDDDGAHVTEIEENTFRKNPKGGNALLDSHGLKIREGVDDIAEFLKDDISMRTSKGIKILEIKSEGSTTTLNVIQRQTGPLEYSPKLPFTVLILWTESMKWSTVEVTEPGTIPVTRGEATGSVTYKIENGKHIVEMDGPLSGIIIDYNVETPLPYYSFGIRTGEAGPFSCIIGESLYAPEQGLVVGKYNAEKDTPVRFAVGVGTSDENRQNVFTVYDDGAEVEGFLKVGDVEIGGTASGEPTITTSTGNLVNASYYKWGNIVTLALTVNNDNTIAAGGKVYLGKLRDAGLLPPANCRSGSYYGSHCIGANISPAGDIVVQNASNSGMTASGSTTLPVCFTYVIDN